MDGFDWYYAYRPAALLLLSGHSPYSGTEAVYANAPWGLIPLLPLALLPEYIGWLLLVAISVISFAFVAIKLGASPMAMIAFLLSPFVVRCLYYGQIDWLPLLGVVMPPTLGLFFVVIKPQVGIGIALFWAIEAWKLGGWKKVVKTFAPVSLALIASFIVFGLWPMNSMRIYQSANGGAESLWPLSIVLGLVLIIVAKKRNDIHPSIAASPCLSPYVRLHSWSSVLLSIVQYQWITVIIVALLWLAEFGILR